LCSLSSKILARIHVTCMYVFAIMLAMLVQMLRPSCMLYISFLAYSSAWCLFQKLMLIYSLDSCIANKGEKCASNSVCITNKGEKCTQFIKRGIERNAFRWTGYSVQGENLSSACICLGGACIHAWDALVSPEVALCFALLPMVLSPFTSP
jgi:hypothetical protein